MNENAEIVNRKLLPNGRMKVTWSNGSVQYTNVPRSVPLRIIGPGRFFKNHENKIKNALNLLHGHKNLQLAPAYVYGALKRANANYVMMRNNKISGFAVVSHKNKNLHLDVIVTQKGLGSQLINQIIKNAKNKKITLNSVPKAVGFYKRHGFTRNNVQNPKNALVKMTRGS